MLKGIDPLLTPELLMHLCAMGHGEWVAVVDANFTADFLSHGKPVVRVVAVPDAGNGRCAVTCWLPCTTLARSMSTPGKETFGGSVAWKFVATVAKVFDIWAHFIVPVPETDYWKPGGNDRSSSQVLTA